MKQLLMEQVKLTGAALLVHRKACPPDLMGLQEKLEEFFSELKQEMDKQYGPKRSIPILKRQKSDSSWARKAGGLNSSTLRASNNTPTVGRRGLSPRPTFSPSSDAKK